MLELVNLWTNSTTRYNDGQSPRKKYFLITKVSVSVFSGDISKSKEISRWRPINRALHYDFSATKIFKKIATIVYQKDSHSFQQWVQQEEKQSILQDYI